MRRPLLKLSLTALLVTTFQMVQWAQIRIQVEGVANEEVYLANYYGEKLFYNDTTTADANGYFEFKAKPNEEGGKYAVVIPGPKFFEIIVTDEPIHITTSAEDLSGQLDVKASKENKLFYDYMGFIQEMRNARAAYDEVLTNESSSEKARDEAKKAIEQLNVDVVNYQQGLIRDHQETLFAKMLLMTLEPEVGSPPAGTENEALWKYLEYRSKYWDNVDFSDGRLVRDPMFHRLLDKYWSKVLPQSPDTLIKEAHALVARAQDPDMFKYMTHHITFSSEKSNVMCMDKVFVSMVNTYYRTGKADWLNEEQLQKVIDRADDLKYVLCGEPVPDVILPDETLTNWRSLYDIDAKYTLIVIWEASCGHCKKEMPKLLELYEQWKPRGLEVYAIGNDFESEPWLKFIKDKQIDVWTNVSDNPAINKSDSASKLIYGGVTTLPSLNFRSTFDVFSTPKMFLLDADKRIIAKQLGAVQLAELLDRLEELEPGTTVITEKKNDKAKPSSTTKASSDSVPKQKSPN